jgi:8-oxo-dGTP pyrophosphatase MutT (NUDIX family)
MTEATSRTIEKAGVVAFTPGGSVLICTSLSDSSKWVMPKGHCDEVDGKLEDHLTTALREVKEEIGWSVSLYSAQPVAEYKRFLFTEKLSEESSQPVYEHVVWFVGEIDQRIDDGERPVLQISPLHALLTLSHNDTRQVLINAIIVRSGGTVDALDVSC